MSSDTEYPWLTGIDRYRLALALGLGIAIGFFPITYAMRRPLVFVYVGIVAIAVPLWNVNLARVARGNRPLFKEYVRATLTQAFYAQWIGLAAGLVWLLAFWSAKLIGLTSLEPDAYEWAFWVWLIGFVTLGTYGLNDLEYELVLDVYPAEPQTTPRFLEPTPIRTARMAWLVFAVLVGIGVLAFFTDSWVDVALFVGVFLVSFSASPEPRLFYEIEPYQSAVERIAGAFRSSGYTVTENPWTGDETVDPLLSEVDLYVALAEPPDLVVDVKMRGRVDWTLAAGVVTAADVLEDWAAEGGATIQVRPLLVLVETTAGKELRGFAPRSGLTILEIGEEAVGIYPEETPETLQHSLRGVARRYQQASEEAAAMETQRPGHGGS